MPPHPLNPLTPPHDGAIIVRNAGVVLFAPYLPRLWKVLGLVGEKDFLDSAAAKRAAHLLNVLVFGETKSVEPVSALDRLLCGLPITLQDNGSFEISATERETIDSLLVAVIAHWPTIGQTSTAGLRETFLQREGVLTQGEGCWNLQVQPAPIDVLLDRLPWSFAICRFPWMSETLHVAWR